MFCPPTILILFTNQSKAEEGGMNDHCSAVWNWCCRFRSRIKRKDRNSCEDLPHQKCKSCNQCRELNHNGKKTRQWMNFIRVTFSRAKHCVMSDASTTNNVRSLSLFNAMCLHSQLVKQIKEHWITAVHEIVSWQYKT